MVKFKMKLADIMNRVRGNSTKDGATASYVYLYRDAFKNKFFAQAGSDMSERDAKKFLQKCLNATSATDALVYVLKIVHSTGPNGQPSVSHEIVKEIPYKGKMPEYAPTQKRHYAS